MEKKLYDGIIETIKCYGLKHINEYLYSNDGKSIDVMFNKTKVSIFHKENLVIELNEEHLSLNAICAILSNI